MSGHAPSDTSPLRALAFLGEPDLLRRLFDTVFIPPAVARELSDPDWADLTIDPRQFAFISVQAPSNLTVVDELQQLVDLGESEAIALAL